MISVAAGTGVSLGRGVAVGCNPARAVSKAWVYKTFTSEVGDEGSGWQALRRMERSKKEEVKRRKVK